MSDFKIISVEHIETEQFWAEETTRFWFQVKFEDEGDITEEQFGLCNSGPDSKLLDSEGRETSDNWRYSKIKSALEQEVTSNHL